MNRVAAPEIRMTAHIFEQVYGAPPATTRHVSGALPILDGVHVPLPWGAVVAAGRSDDGATSLYSMNHHAQGAVTPSTAADWARDCLTALNAYADPGTRVLVNRELPAETGLLTGDETVRATALALRDLHGDPAEPLAEPLPGLCDLSGTSLRLVVIDVGSRRPPAVPPAVSPPRPDLHADRPADLGPLLTDAHARGDPAHDAALEAALHAGALGGRTVGACLAILAPATAVPAIRARVAARLAPVSPRPPRCLTI